jgi:hypothetical protein
VWRNVPDDARVSIRNIHCRWSSAAAVTTIDLLTKPLKRGTAEIEKPPII